MPRRGGLPADNQKAFRDTWGRDWWGTVAKVWRGGEDFGTAIAGFGAVCGLPPPCYPASWQGKRMKLVSHSTSSDEVLN